MPSGSSGNRKIKAIKIYKDHVTLSFFKGEPLKISKEAFLTSYLYAGKALSSKEINKLKDITAMSELLNYALSLVSKKHYSEKEMLEKLLKKEDNFLVAKQVINKLKENDLLDDKAFMEDLINWDNERNFGQNKIIKHLRDKGIPESLINKAHFSSSNERKKAKALLPKLEKKYSRYNYESKKRHIFNALLTQGFIKEVAREVIEEVKRTSSKDEEEKLYKDYLKLKSRYEKKYEGYKLKEKLYSALLTRGYASNQIKKVLEDLNHDDYRFA